MTLASSLFPELRKVAGGRSPPAPADQPVALSDSGKGGTPEGCRSPVLALLHVLTLFSELVCNLRGRGCATRAQDLQLLFRDSGPNSPGNPWGGEGHGQPGPSKQFLCHRPLHGPAHGFPGTFYRTKEKQRDWGQMWPAVDFAKQRQKPGLWTIPGTVGWLEGRGVA